jgi:homoserine kinase
MIVARVPATSANIGSGFDCFGLALSLFNDVALMPDNAFGVEIVGEGAESLPRDRSNLVMRTVFRFFDMIGRRPPASFRLKLTNRIPMTGGLGSSSTALVGGLLVANRFVDDPVDRADLLRMAFELEGHPDNVAPAILGGFVLSVVDRGKLITVPMAVPDRVKAVLFLPRFSTSTREARRLLPSRVSHADAVFNLSRAALLVSALASGRLDLLRVATQDRLHQPYRQVLFPTMPRFLEGALEAGAVGSWLSGSGSALLAMTEGGEKSVAEAFESIARTNGVAGRSLIVDVEPHGAVILPPES